MHHLLPPALLLLALGAGAPAPPASGSGAPHLAEPRTRPLVLHQPSTGPRPVAVGLPPGQTSPDSVTVLREARDAQARFERLRVLHSPRSGTRRSGPCDEHVGRFCVRFGSARDDGDEPDWRPPPEPQALVEAREELLELLAGAAQLLPGDRWITGQRATYLAEAGRWDEMLETSSLCASPGWWCHALRGWAHHGMGETQAAEGAFDVVLSLLGDEEREAWEDPGILLDPEVSRRLSGLDQDERMAMSDRIWRLADPLFLEEGNPVRVEHFVRRVLSEVRSEARNPHALPWASDLARLLTRYGPVVSYERVPDPPTHMGPPSVVGRYHPEARYLMPPAAKAGDLIRTEVEDWRTDRRRTRSRHAPPGSPRIGGMEAQFARFHRGDSLLLLAAWEPHTHPTPGASDTHGGEGSPMVRSGVVLLDAEDLGRSVSEGVQGEEVGGFASILVPAGGYLLSIEAIDAAAERAWRQRVGLEFQALHPEVVGLSDLLLLSAGGIGDPEGGEGAGYAYEGVELEELLPRMRPGTRVEPGELLVAWELYGLADSDGPVELRLSATPEDPGLLRRAGEWIRLLSPRPGTSVAWEEQLPEEHPRSLPHLRAMGLDVSGLEPGEYRLTLTLSAPGRTDVTTSRTIEVTSAPTR